MKKIGLFDIDGVIADTGKAMINIVQNDLNKKWVSVEDIVEYDVTKLSWLNNHEIEHLLTKFCQPEFYYYIPPMPYAAEVTDILRQKGWEIILVTARPPFLYDITLYWLKKYSIHFNSLISSRPEEKINYCVNNDKCFLVEDRGDLLLQIEEKMPEMKIFIYDQPWNRRINVGKRIKTLKEIVEVLGI